MGPEVNVAVTVYTLTWKEHTQRWDGMGWDGMRASGGFTFRRWKEAEMRLIEVFISFYLIESSFF